MSEASNKLFKSQVLPPIQTNANNFKTSLLKRNSFNGKLKSYEPLRPRYIRTNSEINFFDKLLSLKLENIEIKNENNKANNKFYNSFYFSKDSLVLPEIGSCFSSDNFKLNKTESFQLNKTLTQLTESELNLQDSFTYSNSFSYESDIKNLFKVSLTNKRIDVCREEQKLEKRPRVRVNQVSQSQKKSRNKYEIITTIANGIFGTTYLVNLSNNRKKHFVMKLINLTNTSQKEVKTNKQRQLFLYKNLSTLINNIKTCTLNHVNLIFINDMFISRNLKTISILTDYYNETNLDTKIRYHRVKQTFIDGNLILNWFYDTISAIDYLYEKGLMHSNLKPSNFLLSNDMNIKLTDFGYLHVFNLITNANNLRTNEFFTKMIKKSFIYLPRETIERFEYTHLSEIYCIGSIFFEVMTLERYEWTKQADLRSELDKLTFKDEIFNHLLATMLSNTPAERPNIQTIDRFINWKKMIEIKKLIKTGRFGTTSLIHCKKTSKNFVLKQLSLAKSNKLKTIEVINALKELNLSDKNEIAKENLVFIAEHHVVDYKLYIITEHVLNGTLEDRINEKKWLNIEINENVILEWMTQVIYGLTYLHSKSIIHANLKCENILFTTANIIKLVDFGFYHLLGNDEGLSKHNFSSANKPPEFGQASVESPTKSKKFLNSANGLTQSTDIYMLGTVLFNCMSLKEFKREEIFEKKDETEADLVAKVTGDYSQQLKLSLIKTLNDSPNKRPQLKDLAIEFYHLFDSIYYKLIRETPFMKTFNASIKTIVNKEYENRNDMNEFVVLSTLASFHKQKKPTSEAWLRVSFNKNDMFNFNDKSQFSFDSESKLKLSLTNQKYSLSKKIAKENKNFLVQIVEKLPKFLCFVGNNSFIGCDNQNFYLINENLELTRTISLMDTLEMRNKGSYRSKTNSNTLDLNIKVKALTYDTNIKKVFLLLTIHGQQTLLNIFDLEFKAQIHDNSVHMSLFKTFHVPLVPKGSKSMICNENYLFVCEKKLGVRTFNKQNGQYLFSLRSFEQFAPQTPTLKSQTFNKNDNFDTSCNIKNTLTRNERVQDICMDLNNNIYVAYNYSIELYSSKGEFKWKHAFETNETIANYNNSSNNNNNIIKNRDFRSSSLLSLSSTNSNFMIPERSSMSTNIDNINLNSSKICGKIIKISVNKVKTLVIITQDEQNKFKNRFYVFS